MVGESLSLRVHRGVTGLAEIRDAWAALAGAQQPHTLMHYPEPYESYLATMAPAPEDFTILTVHRGKELVAVLPLQAVVRRVLGIPFTFIESPDTLLPRNDIICAADVSWDNILRCIRREYRGLAGRQWHVMRLVGIPETSPCMRGPAASPDCAKLMMPGRQNNLLDTTDPEYFQNRLTANMRNNLRRAERRLHALGEPVFRTVGRLPELDEAFEQFIDVEASGWKSRRGGKRAIRLNPSHEAFYRDLIHRFAASARCEIHLLELDGRTLAGNLSICIDGVSYSMKSGYDEAFRSASPGHLLRWYETDRYAADPDICQVDLFSHYRWQDDWKPVHRRVFNVYFFNRTWPGTAWRAALTLRRRARGRPG